MARRGFSGIATFENRQTGDGRVFTAGSWEWSDDMAAAGDYVFEWVPEDEGAHIGAEEIGRLTSLTREGDAIRVAGWVDDDREAGAEWIRIAEASGSMGVSAVWDDYELEVLDMTGDTDEVELVVAAAGDPDPGADAGTVLIEAAADEVLERWTRVRFRKLASVTMPAFQESLVYLDAIEPVVVEEEDDDTDEEDIDEEVEELEPAAASSAGCGCGGHTTSAGAAGCSCMAVAAPAVLAAATGDGLLYRPPASWFAYDAELFAGYREATEFGYQRITDDGEVYGYVSGWDECHTGYHGECVLTPHSDSGYANFLLGYRVCADGSEVGTGSLTLGGGHADGSLSYIGAVEHYDNTCAAYADVMVGEDEHGVWFHGALRPELDELTILTARASKLSGDWRPVRNGLELVAGLCVNSPGFRPPRALATVASNGRVLSLIASGGGPVRRPRDEGGPGADGIEERLAVLEAVAVSQAKARLLASAGEARTRALARLRG